MQDDLDATGSWITKTPGVCGGDACLRRTRHTVAGLVQWKQLGLDDEEILRHHPDLTAADLCTAWEYYERNQDEIDGVIQAEQEA